MPRLSYRLRSLEVSVFRRYLSPSFVFIEWNDRKKRFIEMESLLLGAVPPTLEMDMVISDGAFISLLSSVVLIKSMFLSSCST